MGDQSQRKATIWIDLTDLSAWSAHMTGIQRVVYNVARHFSDEGTGRFFVYDRSGRVDEVSFHAATHDIGPDRVVHSGLPTLAVRGVNFGVRVIKGVGRRMASPELRDRAWQKVAAVKERRRRKTALRSGVVERRATIHPFAAGDVVVLMGASWREEGQLDYIGDIRREMGIVVVHTVYDLIPIKFPQFFGVGFGQFFLGHMFDVFAESDHILAISQHTKRDTIEFQREMGLRELPASTFRLGDNPTHLIADESPDHRIIAGEYILAVGTLEIRKNYLALYHAWVMAADRGISMPQLVIVGQVGWLTGDLIYQIQTDPRVAHLILLKTAVDDAGLAWLYSNSILTVYPSWYEGWGLPIAESLHYGKLCIASRTSSMTEIAGELIEYSDPYEPEQFLDVILSYLDDRDRLARAEERIRSDYVPATWSESYLQVMAALEPYTRATARRQW
jgi:glycosyltransferase involved in cell wall biosynthesis